MPASKCISATPAPKCLSMNKHKAFQAAKCKQTPKRVGFQAEVPNKRQRLGPISCAKVREEETASPGGGMPVEPVIRMLRKVMNILQVKDSSKKESHRDKSNPTVACAVAKAHIASGSTRKGWDNARDVERRAKEAQRKAEDAAQKLEASLLSKGSRRSSGAKAAGRKSNGSKIQDRRRAAPLSAEAFKQRSKAVAVAKKADAEAEASVQTLTRRKEAVVTAQQDYLKPLLALEEGDEQSEELVASLIKVLAESDLEIGGKSPWKATHLAQLLAWDPTHRCPSEKKLWQQLDETLSKAEAYLEEKLARARRDRDARAAALAGAQAVDKAWTEVRTLGPKSHAAHQASALAAEKWFVDVQAGPLPTYLWMQKNQEMALVPVHAAKKEQ